MFTIVTRRMSNWTMGQNNSSSVRKNQQVCSADLIKCLFCASHLAEWVETKYLLELIIALFSAVPWDVKKKRSAVAQ